MGPGRALIAALTPSSSVQQKSRITSDTNVARASNACFVGAQSRQIYFAAFLAFLACRFSLAVLAAGVLLARPPLSLPAMMAFPQPDRNASQKPLSHRYRHNHDNPSIIDRPNRPDFNVRPLTRNRPADPLPTPRHRSGAPDAISKATPLDVVLLGGSGLGESGGFADLYYVDDEAKRHNIDYFTLIKIDGQWKYLNLSYVGTPVDSK